jgi:hypothetical protein
MTNPNDMWAQAANAQAQAAPQAANTTQNTGNGGGNTAPAGRVANAVQNMDNPFMTSQEATPATSFDPYIPYAYLENRPVVLMPKRFTDQDEKPANQGGGLRDKWTVDIVILAGEPFSFTYKAKEKDANGQEIEVEKTHEVTSFPATFRGQSIWSGQLIAALNGADKAGAFIFGTWCKVPTRQNERAGQTRQKLAAATAQWRQDVAAGRTTQNQPSFTYNLVTDADVWTPEYVNAAMAWWEQEKANRLNTAS